jgi:hypothetical protein
LGSVVPRGACGVEAGGYVFWGDPSPGEGFVTWIEPPNQRLVAASLSAPGNQTPLRTQSGSDYKATIVGNRAAWFGLTNDGSQSIYVVDLSVDNAVSSRCLGRTSRASKQVVCGGAGTGLVNGVEPWARCRCRGQTVPTTRGREP